MILSNSSLWRKDGSHYSNDYNYKRQHIAPDKIRWFRPEQREPRDNQ